MIFFETGRRFNNLSAYADIVFMAGTWITIGSLPSFAKIDLPSWYKMDRFVYGAAFGPSYYYIQWCTKISQFSGTTGADGIMLKVAWKWHGILLSLRCTNPVLSKSDSFI